MGPEHFEERSEKYEAVLQAMYNLDDEKHATAAIKGETGPIGGSIDEYVQDLILLGEVELCQVSGVGGRVWLKRTPPGDRNQITLDGAFNVWQGYSARGYRDRIADRLFRNRESAIMHLSESAVIDPVDFTQLSFLEDVWVADTTDRDGFENMTAVVRREPVFATSDAGERLYRATRSPNKEAGPSDDGSRAENLE